MKPENLYTSSLERPVVSASILSADFNRMGNELDAVLDGGARSIHVDIMDGHFVPNLSMGPAVCAAVRRHRPDTCIDVHLMVTDPRTYAPAFIEAGADHVTFHVEVEENPLALRDEIHRLGASAGLAINPDTPVEVIEPFINEFDLILVMSVHPGFSGQSFIHDVLDKTKAISSQQSPTQRLEMDGGISPLTAPACREAGCDVLVSASAIFGSETYAEEIARIGGFGVVEA